jgi:hypothetical protein
LIAANNTVSLKIDEDKTEELFTSKWYNDDFLLFFKRIYSDLGLKYMTFSDLLKIIEQLCDVDIYELYSSVQVYLDLDTDTDDEEIDLELLLELHHDGTETYNFGIQYLLQNPLEIWEAPSVFSEYKDLIMELIEIDYRVVENMPDIMKDIQMLESVVTKNPKSLKYFPQSLIESSTTVMNQLKASLLSEHPSLIKIVPDVLKDDPKIMEQIVRKRGKLIKYASARIQCDDRIMQMAIEDDNSMIKFASERLQNDVDIISHILANDSRNLKYIQKSVISSHPELFLSVAPCIESESVMRKYLIGDIVTNKECMLTVMTKFGRLIEYVSDSLKCDLDIIKASIISDLHNLKFVPDPSIYHNDQNIQDQIRIQASQDIHLLKYASDYLRSDSTLFINLVESKKCDALLYLSDILKDDKQFIALLCDMLQEYIDGKSIYEVQVN